MRTSKIILILSVIFISATTLPVYAPGRGHGGHGGGGRGGGYSGHVGRGGYYRGGAHASFRGYYGGGYHGWFYHPFYWGPVFGWPYLGLYYDGWPYLGWPYPYSYYPYYSDVPPAAYSESEQQPYYWYYCQDPQGYYPYVRDCPGGWMTVAPSNPDTAPAPASEAPAPPVPAPGEDPPEAPIQPAGKPLTNDAVTALVKAGLSDAAIVSVIQKSPTRFDLGPEALIKLKEAGISNTVIEAMAKGGSPSSAESAPQLPPVQGPQALPVQQPSAGGTVKTLLQAIVTSNYDVFVANAAPALKTRITKDEFKRVSTQLSPRLKKGYELQYLGNLKQQKAEIFLWKIIYKDGGDDGLANLVLQGDKVAGFWIQ